MAPAKLTQATLIKQEIGRLENRIKQARIDRYDGNLGPDEWAKLNGEWQAEKVRLAEALKHLNKSDPSSYLPSVRKVLELSNRLKNLYFSATSEEKRELVNHVCSNLVLKGKKIEFTYKKPFDLLAEGLHSAIWLPD
ncbi:MAG: hypothetical protein PHU21_13680 [Elusimicrobia bacterium]|nr:hypothetical protein [Elusimicrobiota bacterium]